jgi:hypothetical protein
MKTTKLLFSVLFALTIALSANAVEKSYQKVLGTWEYSAPSAPYPYSAGTIVLKDVADKLAGEFNIQGEKISAKEVTFANDEVILKFEVEYEPVVAKLLKEISFGGGAVNDAIMHFTNNNLPFGGVGNSGIGSYHGKAGFITFSHYKSILDKPFWLEPNLKYSPYSERKLSLIKRLIG